jgi:hypothetical protein
MSLVESGYSAVVQDDFYSGTRHLVSKIFQQRMNTVTLKPGRDAADNLLKLLQSSE